MLNINAFQKLNYKFDNIFFFNAVNIFYVSKLCFSAHLVIVRRNGGRIVAPLQAVTKYTPRAPTLRLTCELTRGRSRTNARGKDARGGLHDLTN